MRVVKIETPGCATVKDIPNTLEALQTAVGGYIETVQLFADRDFTFVCNEEGRLKGLAPNCFGMVGTVLAVGVKGDEFCDIPIEKANFIMNFVKGVQKRSGTSNE